VVLALNGELGAGKTTFTKVLAKELGIMEHITSPTFVIQKSYSVPQNIKGSNPSMFKTLVHIDAYRLENGDDAKALDLQNTVLNPANLVVIEWAKNIKSALPESTINIDFKYVDETTREIKMDL
jgi:tRNA threonylcarbamoyladenosine biosynthesis protein TsaE